MTLSDSVMRVISAVCVALLSYLPKRQRATLFNRLSITDKTRLFSLLNESRGGFLDDYSIQNQMQAYGIRYSPQFMKNLFYYTHKNNILADNKSLSAFLSLPGFFICKENGEIRLQKGIQLLNFIVFLASIFIMIFAPSQLPESLGNLPLYLAQQHYFLLALEGVSVLVFIIGLIMPLVFFYTLLFQVIPAFRFAKSYRAAWKSRDLFEVGEQNLYCGNKIKE